MRVFPLHTTRFFPRTTQSVLLGNVKFTSVSTTHDTIFSQTTRGNGLYADQNIENLITHLMRERTDYDTDYKSLICSSCFIAMKQKQKRREGETLIFFSLGPGYLNSTDNLDPPLLKTHDTALALLLCGHRGAHLAANFES
jgi:hypothetical protein